MWRGAYYNIAVPQPMRTVECFFLSKWSGALAMPVIQLFSWLAKEIEYRLEGGVVDAVAEDEMTRPVECLYERSRELWLGTCNVPVPVLFSGLELLPATNLDLAVVSSSLRLSHPGSRMI